MLIRLGLLAGSMICDTRILLDLLGCITLLSSFVSIISENTSLGALSSICCMCPRTCETFSGPFPRLLSSMLSPYRLNAWPPEGYLWASDFGFSSPLNYCFCRTPIRFCWSQDWKYWSCDEKSWLFRLAKFFLLSAPVLFWGPAGLDPLGALPLFFLEGLLLRFSTFSLLMCWCLELRAVSCRLWAWPILLKLNWLLMMPGGTYCTKFLLLVAAIGSGVGRSDSSMWGSPTPLVACTSDSLCEDVPRTGRFWAGISAPRGWLLRPIGLVVEEYWFIWTARGIVALSMFFISGGTLSALEADGL